MYCTLLLLDSGTGWLSTIGCVISTDYFLQESPIISGSFAENDLQLKVSFESSPPCTVYCTLLLLDSGIRGFVVRGNVGVFCGNMVTEAREMCSTLYGLATISRLLKIIGLFCRIWSL